MKFKTENKVMTVFSVATLTDIMFLLLIFFLVTSTFAVQSGIKVQLPSAEQVQQKSENELILTITEKGTYYINNQRTGFDDLGKKIAGELADNSNKLIIINADKSVSLQRAVEVMDVAKHVGASRFLIATTQDKGTKSRR